MAHRNLQTKGIVYFLLAPSVGRLKIGFSKNLRRRMVDLQSGSPVEVKLLTWVQATLQLEQLLHQVFAKYRLHNEWFECHEDLLSFVKRFPPGSVLEPEMIISK